MRLGSPTTTRSKPNYSDVTPTSPKNIWLWVRIYLQESFPNDGTFWIFWGEFLQRIGLWLKLNLLCLTGFQRFCENLQDTPAFSGLKTRVSHKYTEQCCTQTRYIWPSGYMAKTEFNLTHKAGTSTCCWQCWQLANGKL